MPGGAPRGERTDRKGRRGASQAPARRVMACRGCRAGTRAPVGLRSPPVRRGQVGRRAPAPQRTGRRALVWRTATARCSQGRAAIGGRSLARHLSDSGQFPHLPSQGVRPRLYAPFYRVTRSCMTGHRGDASGRLEMDGKYTSRVMPSQFWLAYGCGCCSTASNGVNREPPVAAGRVRRRSVEPQQGRRRSGVVRNEAGRRRANSDFMVTCSVTRYRLRLFNPLRASAAA